MVGDRPCLFFFNALGTQNVFAHQDFYWALAAANKHINLSTSPSLFLIFPSLLTVIPPPHLSLSPLFAGDTSATPLAKGLAEKAAGLHPL